MKYGILIEVTTLNDKICFVRCKTAKSNIEQSFLLEDVPNLIKDITEEKL